MMWLYALEQEWEILEKWQKEMYQQEMKTNDETLDSLGDQGTLRTKEEECHLNGLQERGFCAPLSKEERKILSDQRAALQHPTLQETEILNKSLDITASNQDKNDPWHKPMGTPENLEIPPGLRLYSCFVCRKVFQIKRDFVKHKRNYRESQSCQYPKHKNKSGKKAELRWLRPVLCKQQPLRRSACELSSCLRCSLAPHQVVRPGPWPCPKCGKAFWSKAAMNKHVCSPRGERPFSCRDCGRGESPSRDEPAEHLRVHSGRIPFQGPQGGRGPLGEAAAKAHQWAHGGSKLTEHVRVHTGEKPFRCPECQRSFCLKSSLRAHLCRHSGRKPFRCPECSRSFSGKASLKGH
ncbi:zinc finger protein 425-like [Kogia breviceps]|uniref:zinc finger protein 425-like n=1 Tax=Kogia breviceps TaxID=27615 RepID=UPI0034D161C7